MTVAPSPSPAGSRGAAGWRIGVDVGGTFTDLVLLEPDGAVSVSKVPSVPSDPGAGVLAALDAAAAARGVAVGELLAGCAVLVHGSTVATNTVLEHKGARVGLLTTKGFRDSLEIRRGIRPDPWRHREPYPEVLVPRHLRLPVEERIDRDGREAVPLREPDVAEAAAHFRKAGVQSVAIALFNSFLNPDHERQAREVLGRAWDLPWVSLSSAISPTMGEYERTSTAVVNAYIAPRTVGYLQRLAEELSARGLRQDMLMMQNNAGTATVRQLADRPSTLLLSGPAAAVGALEFYRAAAGTDDLISMEIGGTSCDIAMMAGGRVGLTDALSIDGYDLTLPSVDVHTIGAGGGTIAGVDAGGLLYAGPAGAGAVPGPACYGRGGTQPTATDAQVVLGRLAPGTFAGGNITIDGDRARHAVEEHIAAPLGLSVEDAAAGVIRLLEQKLLQGVQRISSERGHDPRRFTLVACGGAGPIHGAPVARRLGCARVFVPKLAGAFCALGLLNSDLRQDYVRVLFADLDGADAGTLDAAWAAMRDEAAATLADCGIAEEARGYERAADLRYRGQQWDVTVAVGDVFDPGAVRQRFEAEHERLFGHIQPEGTIEITKLRLSGIGRVERARPPAAGLAATEAPTPRAVRPVWLDETSGWREVPVYDHADLRPGHRLAGPLVVDEATTTILVGTNDRLDILSSGDYLIHVD